MKTILDSIELSFVKVFENAVHKHRADFTDIVISGEEEANYETNSISSDDGSSGSDEEEDDESSDSDTSLQSDTYSEINDENMTLNLL